MSASLQTDMESEKVPCEEYCPFTGGLYRAPFLLGGESYIS